MLLPLLLGQGTWNGTVEGSSAAQVGALGCSSAGYHLHPAGAGSNVGAVQFNAAADALRLGDSPSVPANNGSYTLTFWVRPQSGAGDPSVWYDNDAAGTDLILGTNSGVVACINGNGFTNIATVGSAVSNNVWYFVALRVNGTTATVSRGDETNAVTHASGTCPAQGAAYRLWFGGTASAFFPTADMALVRMWDGVLSDAQVEAERGSPTPVVTAGLFGDWRLAADSSKLVNSSSGGNLAAVGAGPWADVTGPSVGAAVTEAVAQVTLSAFTPSATAGAGVGGSATPSLAAFASTATGTASSGSGEVTGTAAASMGALTPSATANAGASGATSVSLSVFAPSASGSAGVGGSAATSLAAFTSSASSTAGLSGAAAVSLSAFTSTASGIVTSVGPLDWSGLMPLISRGKPIYGTGTPGQMNDGFYGYVDGTAEGAWACTAGSWVAINVGAGASQVLVGLSNDNAGGGSYLSSVIQAYRLQVSSDSTNGSDGTWTTAVTVTGNGAYAREHKFAFTGYSWVKLLVDTCTGGQLDELNVWDASFGTPDTFAFLGDSITDGALRRHFYFGGGLLPSFQENVETNQPGHYPLQLNVGVTGQGASYWATNISSALALYPDVEYWCINLGMNDGASMPSQLTQWRTDMTTVVNAITGAGRVPIIARTTWTGAAGYGGGNYDTCPLRGLNDNGVDWIVSTLGVRAGPDLFALFHTNGTAYAVNSDPHPNEAGYKGWTNAWADNLGIADANYRHGFAAVALSAFASTATGTASAPAITGTGATTLADATSAGSGSSTVGTGATTLGAATSTGTGTFGTGVTGTGATTLAAATSSGAGSSTTGAGASLLGAATATGVGAHGVAGSSAVTLAAAVSSGSGTVGAGIFGSSTVTLAAATSSGSGTHGTAGTGASSLSGVVSAGSGTFTPPLVTGSSTVTLAGVTSAAAGSTATGTSLVTLAGVTSVAVGVVGDTVDRYAHPGTTAVVTLLTGAATAS